MLRLILSLFYIGQLWALCEFDNKNLTCQMITDLSDTEIEQDFDDQVDTLNLAGNNIQFLKIDLFEKTKNFNFSNNFILNLCQNTFNGLIKYRI